MFQFGGVAEWSKAPVLKTGVGQPTGGSNPPTSAKYQKQGVCLAFVVFCRRGGVFKKRKRKNLQPENTILLKLRSCNSLSSFIKSFFLIYSFHV